jgi:hypothetical protein
VTRSFFVALVMLALVGQSSPEIVLTSVSRTARTRVASDAFSVNIDGLWNVSWTWTPEARRAHFAAMAAAGLRVVRAGVVWEEVQKCAPNPPSCPGTFDWSRHDEWIADLAKAGLRADLDLGWSALWASSVPGVEFAPPSSPATFVAFATAVARRYGRGGEFWSANPNVPYVPATTYEVWNEENMTWWWRPGADPAAYADLYLQARTGLKAVDPLATVIIGGIARAPWTDASQMRDLWFVGQMYTKRPQLKGNVDGLAYHPYAKSADEVLTLVRDMRAALRSVGDGGVPLYINEVGWGTKGSGGPVLDESQRALAMNKVADTLARSNCGVRQVAPYTWVSAEANPGAFLDWTGIYNRNATPKSTGAAYSTAVQRLTGPQSTSTPLIILC